MKTIDFSYFIERYNSGEMSDTEKQWFLKELEVNEELRNEVDLRKHTENILKKQNVISLRNKLSEIERKRNEVKNPVKMSKRPVYIKYATVLTGLIIIGGIILLPDKKLSVGEIAKQYYKAFEPPTNQRSVQSLADADFTLALEFYNTHDYNKAAMLFTRVLESKPNDMQTMLLIGVSKYEEKKYPEAKQSFGKVIDNNNNLYVDQARWYLALCYLNTGEKEKAIQLFDQISKESGSYQNDAKKIFKELKE
jgi:tetratricopeptide (TPR) repeat protein